MRERAAKSITRWKSNTNPIKNQGYSSPTRTTECMDLLCSREHDQSGCNAKGHASNACWPLRPFSSWLRCCVLSTAAKPITRWKSNTNPIKNQGYSSPTRTTECRGLLYSREHDKPGGNAKGHASNACWPLRPFSSWLCCCMLSTQRAAAVMQKHNHFSIPLICPTSF